MAGALYASFAFAQTPGEHSAEISRVDLSLENCARAAIRSSALRELLNREFGLRGDETQQASSQDEAPAVTLAVRIDRSCEQDAGPNFTLTLMRSDRPETSISRRVDLSDRGEATSEQVLVLLVGELVRQEALATARGEQPVELVTASPDSAADRAGPSVEAASGLVGAEAHGAESASGLLQPALPQDAATPALQGSALTQPDGDFDSEEDPLVPPNADDESIVEESPASSRSAFRWVALSTPIRLGADAELTVLAEKSRLVPGGRIDAQNGMFLFGLSLAGNEFAAPLGDVSIIRAAASVGLAPFVLEFGRIELAPTFALHLGWEWFRGIPKTGAVGRSANSVWSGASLGLRAVIALVESWSLRARVEVGMPWAGADATSAGEGGAVIQTDGLWVTAGLGASYEL